MSDATTSRLKVSREGVVLIKSFEGFRPRAVRDEDGRWVIGYGHTASAREGLAVSEQDAELLLQYDLLPVVKALNERVSTPLNQHQFDALASFAISVGVERFLASDVLQRLNDGQAGEAADALIGWPEATPPDARLRRRAAERALFVADPAMPMHLADLLAAPLPPPPLEEPAEVLPAPSDARAAAVAALLGETPPATAEEPGWAAELTGPATGPETAFEPKPFEAAAPPVATVHLQRYSPYAASIVGPLPGFPTIEEPAPAPEPEGEAAGAPPADIPVAEAAEPAPAEPEPTWPTAPEPVAPLVPPAPAISPFPPMEEPLVLTPATEADFVEAGRPVWEPGRREESTVPDEETVLFEEEPTLSVLRHEVEPSAPRRFDWSVTGAFVIMGLTGLAACAAAAAAFRKAMVDDSQLNDFMVIGWILAVIGVICVGVSSWNLFVQWGRRG
ncbi:lysozyme [Brevundimonas sp.]|uniref:lysozyme n=1 Tax=Brevundimonas sp. TaxID=1871086 RepID=UPI002D389052|nr:lysozyme [Brevundimonas sp.]HYC73403.1 lysozyme [Brevundimonas sp.]